MSAEQCDDSSGNDATGEGCLPDCTGEQNGWHCDGGDETTPDSCEERCNDNYITTSEQCEDGDTNNLDGCDENCVYELGWTFEHAETEEGYNVTTATPICGDGRVVQGEVCDDGDKDDDIGCLDDCTGAIDGW